MDFGQVDLYALECLKLILSERSVTKAADKVGISQPSMSNILARLRKITGDPLLVRTADGMEPTAFGRALVDAAGNFVDQLSELAAEHGSFDPARSERTFVIQAVDFLTATVIARMCGYLRKSAPGISIVVGSIDLKSLRETLERGEADFALAPIQNLPDTLYSSTIPSSDLCCIAARDHPWIGDTLSVADYAKAAHVGLCLGDGKSPFVVEQNIDDVLARLGYARVKAVQVPSVLAVPAIVASTDLIAAIPSDLAETARLSLPIKILPFPLDRPKPEVSIVWHARSHSDPGSQWMRHLLRKMGAVAPEQKGGEGRCSPTPPHTLQ